MHDIEPHYSWLHLYNSENDEKSPFFEQIHSEFEFTNAVYNFLIHPQWDNFGSNTLYIKVIYADYNQGYCIIELIGEWNDVINNDIMQLKREILELIIHEGIDKFILIGENVLNFHSSDDSYYEEWFNDIEDGWISFINFRPHVLDEFNAAGIDYYVNYGGELDEMDWRKFSPFQLYEKAEHIINHRLQ
jgi:hypothetical protein